MVPYRQFRDSLRVFGREELNNLFGIMGMITSLADDALHSVDEERVVNSNYQTYVMTAKIERLAEVINDLRMIVELKESSAPSGDDEYPNKVCDSSGYVYLYSFDYSMMVPEHRRVMSKSVGRKLGPHEIVHHIDGNKQNNDISNLIILGKSEHSRIHADMRRYK